jgi:hypothetical protein
MSQSEQSRNRMNDDPAQDRRGAGSDAVHASPRWLDLSDPTSSGLGTEVDVDTAVVAPASAQGEDGNILFDAVTIEPWRHDVTLAREMITQVLHKGYLFPIWHPASLVRQTERRLECTAESDGPVAVIRERIFLLVPGPEKSSHERGQTNEEHRSALDHVTLLTRCTPDLADPNEGPLDQRTEIHSTGRFTPPDSTGLMFWPRLSQPGQPEVLFEMFKAGETAPVRQRLMFIDQVAATDPETVKKLMEYYRRW